MTGKTQVQLLKFDALQPTIDALTAATTADANAAAASASAASGSAAAALASEQAADASETAAGAAEIAAEAARDKAEAWADSATPVEASPERRSAKHWATEAQGAVQPLPAAIGNLAAILGQSHREVERLAAEQLGDAVRFQSLDALASILGQIADQINGGQIALRGGSLADPALRIGTVGIYSSAANTLSIAIAGTEVARFTASGLTVYGTLTESTP
jgi:hypothetical protein